MIRLSSTIYLKMRAGKRLVTRLKTSKGISQDSKNQKEQGSLLSEHIGDAQKYSANKELPIRC